MHMSSGGHAESSSDCAARPKARELGLTGYAVPIQSSLQLAAMSWQRPNIGSRVTREGHAPFWERPAVKFLRATRREPPSEPGTKCQILPTSREARRTGGEGGTVSPAACNLATSVKLREAAGSAAGAAA
jgi:hypothetical protein